MTIKGISYFPVFRPFLVGTAKGGVQSLDAPLRIGVRADAFGHNNFTGDIGEVAVFPRALNEWQRKALEKEFSTRWGIGARVWDPKR